MRKEVKESNVTLEMKFANCCARPTYLSDRILMDWFVEIFLEKRQLFFAVTATSCVTT